MAIPVSCGTCGARFDAPASAAGGSVECPRCRAAVAVPGRPGEVVARSRDVPVGREVASFREPYGGANPALSLLGNLLWAVLGGGLILFLFYVLGALVLCVTIVGIPFGIQCFKLGLLSLFPFGKRVVERPTGAGCLATLLNLLWLLTAGIPLALTHLVFALLCAVTIIGIPFAKQHMKLVALSLMPFGKEVR